MRRSRNKAYPENREPSNSLRLGKRGKKQFAFYTAAVLRAKDCAMATADTVRENAEDILADAKAINEKRAEEAAVIEDASEKAEQ